MRASIVLAWAAVVGLGVALGILWREQARVERRLADRLDRLDARIEQARIEAQAAGQRLARPEPARLFPAGSFDPDPARDAYLRESYAAPLVERGFPRWPDWIREQSRANSHWRPPHVRLVRATPEGPTFAAHVYVEALPASARGRAEPPGPWLVALRYDPAASFERSRMLPSIPMRFDGAGRRRFEELIGATDLWEPGPEAGPSGEGGARLIAEAIDGDRYRVVGRPEGASAGLDELFALVERVAATAPGAH